MKRDLVKHLGNLGVASFYAKEAGIPGGITHTKNRRSAIPQHQEINEFLAKKYVAIGVHPIPSDVQMQLDTQAPKA